MFVDKGGRRVATGGGKLAVTPPIAQSL